MYIRVYIRIYIYIYTEDSVQFVFHEYCKLNGHPRCCSVEHNTLVVVLVVVVVEESEDERNERAQSLHIFRAD
jgi:hypothetical protein